MSDERKPFAERMMDACVPWFIIWLMMIVTACFVMAVVQSV